MRHVAAADPAAEDLDLEACGPRSLFDESRIQDIAVVLGSDGAVVDDPSIFGDPHRDALEVASGMGEVHDDPVGAVLVLLRKICGICL